MKVLFLESFGRDLRGIRDRALLRRIQRVVERAERATGVDDLPNLKKLRGTDSYYRIRVGDFRVGLSIEHDRATFIRVLHRREIYRFFP